MFFTISCMKKDKQESFRHSRVRPLGRRREVGLVAEVEWNGLDLEVGVEVEVADEVGLEVEDEVEVGVELTRSLTRSVTAVVDGEVARTRKFRHSTLRSWTRP